MVVLAIPEKVAFVPDMAVVEAKFKMELIERKLVIVEEALLEIR